MLRSAQRCPVQLQACKGGPKGRPRAPVSRNGLLGRQVSKALTLSDARWASAFNHPAPDEWQLACHLSLQNIHCPTCRSQRTSRFAPCAS